MLNCWLLCHVGARSIVSVTTEPKTNEVLCFQPAQQRQLETTILYEHADDSKERSPAVVAAPERYVGSSGVVVDGQWAVVPFGRCKTEANAQLPSRRSPINARPS